MLKNLPKITASQLFLGSLFLLALSYITMVRIGGLTSYPPGYYKDEAGMAVNGYSILKTGRDEFGVPLALFFKNFDDWKEPIFIYSQLPALAVFGMDIYATRLTSALWGLTAVLAMSGFVWLRWKKAWLALVALVLFGLFPWHFHFSRIGFQLITLPAIVVGYLWAVYQFESKKDLGWYWISIWFLGSMFYSYYPGKALGVLFLVLQYSVYCHRLAFRKHLVSWVIFLTALLPAGVWYYYFPESQTSRASQVTINTRYQEPSELIRVYFQGYLDHFSPGFLFLSKGETNGRHSPQYHYPLLWVTGIFLALGLVRLLMLARYKTFERLILAIFITFPIVSAMTTDAPHVHRTVHSIPIFIYIYVLGVEGLVAVGLTCVRAIKNSSLQQGVYTVLFVLGVGLTTAFFWEWQLFYHFYRYQYPQHVTYWFQIPDIKALEAFVNYPTPHFVSHSVAEFRQSTYHLVRKLDPVMIQHQTGDITFIDGKDIAAMQPGYYLLRGEECKGVADTFPQAELLVKGLEQEFCIYKY